MYFNSLFLHISVLIFYTRFLNFVFFRSLYDNKIESLANGTFAPLENLQTL